MVQVIGEYLYYCAVGCINVAIFSALYWILSMTCKLRHPTYRLGAWALQLVVCIQSHFLHRWLTFESDSNIRTKSNDNDDSLCVFLAISTFTFYIFVDTLGELMSWAINTTAFGFLTFLSLRIYAFPLSDGRVTDTERLETFRESRRA